MKNIIINSIGHTTIELAQASVVTFEATAIVNAANSSLAGGSGVDGAIHKAAGQELYFYCRNLEKCKTGDAKISPSFNISTCEYVIHTVGPYYSGNTPEENKRLLKSCYIKSLDLAKDFESIAFPGISTGIYGYPLHEAIEVAIESIGYWLNLNKNTKLKKITLCAFTSTEYEQISEILEGSN